MAEYISKQDVIDYLNGYLNSIGECGADSLLFDRGQRRALINAIQDISAVKAADVQPMKRGKWIETHISLCKWIPEDEKEKGHRFYMAEMKCSCCERYNTQTFSLTLEKPNFCQHCGARMDGDTVPQERCSNYMDCDGTCFIDDSPCDCNGNIEKCKGR